MSRELKFRAWDKLTKQIFKVEQIDFNAIERNVYGFITYKSFLGGVNKSISFRSFDDVELMQFTGLKDCNGKEIYEGDIVKNASDELKVVYFIDGVFVMTDFEKQDIWNCDSDLVAINYCEIVGNTYENSELLK